jgi:mRNA interferase MazF
MKIGEIYLIELPFTDTKEQKGFRPAIILQDKRYTEILPTLLIIPLTSQLNAQRFPATLLIKANKENGLEKDSVALVFQLRAIDQTRIKNRLGRLKDEEINEIYRKIQDLIRERGSNLYF